MFVAGPRLILDNIYLVIVSVVPESMSTVNLEVQAVP